MDVRFLRLLDGSDIVCGMERKVVDGCFMAHNPIRLGMMPNQQIAAIPLCPYSAEKDIPIKTEHIMFNLEPEDQLVNMWNEKFGSGLTVARAKLVIPQ